MPDKPKVPGLFKGLGVTLGRAGVEAAALGVMEAHEEVHSSLGQVELPEAVQFSTLYRMLFLAALTLFAMTFVINTVAEIIRQRFRKRAFQL